MRINQIRQPICTKNHNYQITQCNEFRMSHGEGTSIGKIELEGPKTVCRELSQFVNIHTIKAWAKRLYSSTGFQICNSEGSARPPMAEHNRLACAPVFEVNPRTVLRGDHVIVLWGCHTSTRPIKAY